MHSVEVSIRICKLEKVNIRQYLNSVPYDQQSGVLTLTTLWASSADDKLMIYFLFFPENRFRHFMQIVSCGDNLHKMSKPVFQEK